MAKKAKAPNPFTGRWRIVSMSAWDEEFIIFLWPFTGVVPPLSGVYDRSP
jgi:hypothetical protein